MLCCLIDKGANVNITTNHNPYGCTTLHMAVNYENTDLVKLLLDKGANPNLLNKSEKPPILDAAEKGNRDIVRILIQSNKCDLTITDGFGKDIFEYYSREEIDGFEQNKKQDAY